MRLKGNGMSLWQRERKNRGNPKADYSEYFLYLDSLTEAERQANAKFRLRQKFDISRGKAQKIVGEYYRQRRKQ